ncbi:MAG TPA: dienelactone hydrolase family protein [Hyphomicrobiaceae bacterium]|nr:dienelactone hydrolase family protein [Hyphomicrobiaceae bacterium]
MRILIACALVMLELGASQGTYAAPKVERATFASAQGIEITGYYLRPKGHGRFPAVIGMHGCGGLFGSDRNRLSPNRMDWALRFLNAGYVVLFPDTYGPRGFRSVCEIKSSEQTVRLADHVGDLVGAVAWLSGQSFVDKDRIALVGWGMGGSAVLRILDPGFPLHQSVDLKAAIAFYPRCEPVERGPNYAPRLSPTILMGAADEWVSPQSCNALAMRWGSPIVLYPGAYHNFDVPNVPVRVRRTGEGPKRAGTNPAAREKAIRQVRDILLEAFGEMPSRPKKGT